MDWSSSRIRRPALAAVHRGRNTLCRVVETALGVPLIHSGVFHRAHPTGTAALQQLRQLPESAIDTGRVALVCDHMVEQLMMRPDGETAEG